MELDSNTKVLVAKDGVQNFSITSLPDPKDLLVYNSYLVAESGPLIYELREVNGNNRYQNNNITLPKSKNSVKSFIFEPENKENGQKGYVLQSANLLVSSLYNPVYLVIAILHSNPSLTKRYISMEDFVDSLGGLYPSLDSNSDSEWVQKLLPFYPKALESVCDTITENDEPFFKFSIIKTADFLDAKVQKLTQHLIQNQSSQIVQHVKSKLCQSNESTDSIPKEVLKQAITSLCVDLILGSYCSKEVLKEVFTIKDYSFKEYRQFLDSVQQKQKDLAIIEQNMSEIVETSSKARKKVDAKKPDPRKKVVKKVAIGKGALDGFFKKA